ncbi:MAG: hypothetical protein IJW21_03495, partial [Clostridia bacterium]|nr:hypothetical protein [Clostridia bacterium]
MKGIFRLTPKIPLRKYSTFSVTKKQERKCWRTFETLSTFFFEKKVAKKQKSLLDLSGFVSSVLNQK